MWLAIWVVASWLVGILGSHKKLGFWGFFFCSIIFSPIIGLIIVFASGDDVYNHSKIS